MSLKTACGRQAPSTAAKPTGLSYGADRAAPRRALCEGPAESPSGGAFSLPDCNPPRAMPGPEKILVAAGLALVTVGVAAVVKVLAQAL